MFVDHFNLTTNYFLYLATFVLLEGRWEERREREVNNRRKEGGGKEGLVEMITRMKEGELGAKFNY